MVTFSCTGLGDSWVIKEGAVDELGRVGRDEYDRGEY